MPQPAALEVTAAQFTALETEHPEGLTMFQILECLANEEIHISEATFRKYIQLGLLPQSRRARCGTGGKHSGSQGLYPATVIRYLLEIRARLSAGETLAEIRQDMPASIAQDGIGARLAQVLRELQEEATQRNDLDPRVHRARLREIAALEAKARVLMVQIARVSSALRRVRRVQTRA